jgi:hypothetical protein
MRLKLFVSALAALMLSSVGSAFAADQCLQYRYIRTMQVFDNQTLIAKHNLGPIYEIKFRSHCTGLRFYGVARTRQFDTECVQAGDSYHVINSGVCMIKSVEKIADDGRINVVVRERREAAETAEATEATAADDS